MSSKTYTREEIKEAIRQELTSFDHMGEDNERFYTIVGIVMEGLNKLDKIRKDNEP